MEYSNSPKTLKSSLSKPVKPYQKEEPKLPFKLVGDKKDHPRLIHILNRLCESETGYDQLKIACEGGFTLGFATTSGAIGVCDKAGSYITLNPQFSDDTLVGTLSHESRHACQFARGGDEDFGVENIQSEIIKFRAMEADAETANIAACYELYQKGDKAPFLEYREKSPYITQAFEDALEKSGGVVTNDVKTAAFCGWYNNNGIKRAYENGYHVAFMQEVMKEDSFDTTSYTKNITSEEEINRTCVDQNGCYFSGDKSCLASGKFLDVTPNTKAVFDKFFAVRKEKHGIEVDPTLKNIPVRNDSLFVKGLKSRHDETNKNDTKQNTNIAVDAVKLSFQRGRR